MSLLSSRQVGNDITNTVTSPDRCINVRPLKRQKLSSGIISFNHSNDTIFDNTELSLSRRLLFSQLGHRSFKTAYNSRWLDFKHEAKLFCSSNDERIVLSESNTPLCIESLHNKPISTVGFEGGNMMLISTSNEDKGKILGTSKSHHSNSIYDISISPDDNLMASSSDLCVKIYDFTKNKVIHECIPGNSGPIKQCKFHPNHSSLVLTSTRSGMINLFDLRLSNIGNNTAIPWIESKEKNKPYYSMTQCHDIKLGKAKRTNVSVTSLTWSGYNDYTAISACEADSKLKFWDLRSLVSKTKQTPTYTVEPISNDIRKYAITSIISDTNDNKVWAMCRNGIVYSYYLSSPNQGVIDELVSEDLAVTSFYCKMSLLNPSYSSYSSPNSFYGSYIACGGDKGITLFSKPTTKSSKSQSILLKNGHSKETTGISFQSSTNSLLSISDDMTLRFWKPNESLYENLKNQKLNLLSNSPEYNWVGWSEEI